MNERKVKGMTMAKTASKNHKKIRPQEFDTYIDGDDNAPSHLKNATRYKKNKGTTGKCAFTNMSKDEQSDWKKEFTNNFKYNRGEK